MKNPSSLASRLRRAIALLAIPVVTASLGAQVHVLMLDFGGTNPSNQITNPTNSPYHAAVGADATGTTWNTVGNGNQAAGNLKWADGTTADKISYYAWKFAAGSTATANTISNNTGWQTNPNGQQSTSVNTGIYAVGNVGYDAAMTSSGFTSDNRAIGIQISGLAVGTYDIYVSGRNNQYNDTAYTLNFYAGTNSATGFSIDGYQSHSVTFAADKEDKTDAWVFDPDSSVASNYVKFRITITEENQRLNIASQGANGFNGVLSSLQIVSVIPEPSSYALLAGAGGLLVVGARRRVRNP